MHKRTVRVQRLPGQRMANEHMSTCVGGVGYDVLIPVMIGIVEIDQLTEAMDAGLPQPLTRMVQTR